jgi:hypothetical protein
MIMDTITIRATLDRIEEGRGVLLVRDEEELSFTLPQELLPGGCREGDILVLTIRRDPESTGEAKKRVSSLLDKLQRKG